MQHKLLLVSLLTACADLEPTVESELTGAVDNTSQDSTGGSATDTDDHIPRPGIRSVKWAWEGCTADPSDPAATAAVPTPALRLSVYVDLDASPDGTASSVAGQPSGCESFAGQMATVACFPTLPPTGRVIAISAKWSDGWTRSASVPFEDCVDGVAVLPPDDGDAK